MDTIIEKLSVKDTQSLIRDLLQLYHTKWHAVVNFLYFANAMQYHLFEKARQSEKDKLFSDALMSGDFLLPDGIALQLRTKLTARKKTHNLNGTDLTPQLLSYLNTHWNTSLYIYSLYDPKINKGKERLEKAVQSFTKNHPSINIIFTYQSLYTNRGADFPRENFWEALKRDTNEVKLLLNCIGTPFQEMRVEEHRQFFADHSVLVMNVGGFIDFAAGFEQRAPKWVVKARVLETFWRIATNPKKNLNKFLAMFGIRRILLQKMRLKKS